MKAIARRTARTAFTHRVDIRQHHVATDEPSEHGGDDDGPSPQELLAASLASCTAVTVEMYAKRKGWDIGPVEVECVLDPAPAYGRARTSFAEREGIVIASGGAQEVILSSTVPLHGTVEDVDGRPRYIFRFTVEPGPQVWITLGFGERYFALGRKFPSSSDATELAERTRAFWASWLEQCLYQGPFQDAVRRSALVIKLLTFAPTGALCAAPTTSIPEDPGGDRKGLRESALHPGARREGARGEHCGLQPVPPWHRGLLGYRCTAARAHGARNRAGRCRHHESLHVLCHRRNHRTHRRAAAVLRHRSGDFQSFSRCA